MRHPFPAPRPTRALSILLIVLPVSWVGCGGEEEEPEPPGTCADYVTSPLSSLDRDEWPEGLDEAVTAYRSIAGRWRGDDCANKRANIKFTMQPQDHLRVIAEAPDASVACGCTEDPRHGHDNTMQPLALIPEFEAFFEGDIDAGVDARIFRGTGALFGPDSPVLLRICGKRQIDPVEGSTYDDAILHFRILRDATGTATSTVSLFEVESGAPPVHCDVSDWTYQGP